MKKCKSCGQEVPKICLKCKKPLSRYKQKFCDGKCQRTYYHDSVQKYSMTDK